MDELGKRWLVVVDRFAISLNYWLPVYFSYYLNDLMATGTDAFLQSWDSFQAYAFPSFALIRQVLNNLRSSWGTLLTLIAPLWHQKWFPELRSLVVAPLVSFPMRADILRQSHMFIVSIRTSTCYSFMCGDCARFGRHIGLSRGVASQLDLCRRSSSHRLYQHWWACYHCWCSEKGHSVSSPSVLKIADFLLFLRVEKRLSVPTIRGYCSTLSAVFEFCLPSLQEHFVLRDLIFSFEPECLASSCVFYGMKPF